MVIFYLGSLIISELHTAASPLSSNLILLNFSNFQQSKEENIIYAKYSVNFQIPHYIIKMC